MAESEVQMSASGQLEVPAQLRDQLGLHPGDRLVARVEQDQLIFERAETILERLQQRFAPLRGTGVIDELIAERRAEASKEL